MAEKLIVKMAKQPILTEQDYNEGNLQALHEHIEKTSTEPQKPVYRLTINHKGPTEVVVTEESRKKLAKVLLDL